MSQAISDPAATLTRAFFDQWEVYAEILRRDYMHHRGIEAALRQAADDPATRRWRLLDLGCGDARIIPHAFGADRLRAYTGVDLSAVALEHAARRLDGVLTDDRRELIQGHFSDYLADSEAGRFDAVLIGFALHHLSESEKRTFFGACARVLTDSGRLWLYDVFRRRGESRAAYLSAYRELCSDGWSTLSADALERLQAHVESSDYPETPQTILAMAADAGFGVPDAPLFADAHGIHCLYQFERLPDHAPH